jgi:hypothetical protein
VNKEGIMTKSIPGKVRSIWVGIFILAAYGVIVGTITDSRILILITDGVSGMAVMGIAFLMYPLFSMSSKILSLVYVILKILEGSLMILGGILYIYPPTQSLRDVIYGDIHIYVFIFGALLFYILLLKEQLVPRFISIWGIAGIAVLSLSALVHFYALDIAVIDYFLILIISNEVFLAVWLFIKGFREKKQQPFQMEK